VAPTFGRVRNAIKKTAGRPNVGAAQPCEARAVRLWRNRTGNRPCWHIELATHNRPKVGATLYFRRKGMSAPRAHKKRRPFASGHGLRGGRWPGPQVERDGLSCYCGRGWVSERSNNSMAATITLGGIATAGVVTLASDTRPASDRFTRAQKSFLMATFADQTTGHGRLP
jgi:hypothetical protein